MALVGAKQIIQFCHMLQSLPPSDCVVLNLFVSSTNPFLNPSINREMAPGLEASLQALSRHEDTEPITDASSSSFTLKVDKHSIAKAFNRILQLTAPTLQILHAHFTFIQRPSILLPLTLPRLFELVLYGPFDYSPPVNSSLHTFPSLRRLFLGLHLSNPQQILTAVRPKAPGLTDIYLVLSVTPENIVEKLDEFVEHLEDYWPRTMKKISVEIDSSTLPYSPVVRNLFQQVKISVLGQNRLVLIEDGSGRWVDIASAENDWLDRILGGNGRWKGSVGDK